jgi:hypothetical protein
MGDFHQKSSVNYNFQGHWSTIKPSLRKSINGILHVSHKPYHRFCSNSKWGTSTCIPLIPFLSKLNKCRIWDCHRVDYEELYLLVYNAELTFTGLHGVIFQKIELFKFAGLQRTPLVILCTVLRSTPFPILLQYWRMIVLIVVTRFCFSKRNSLQATKRMTSPPPPPRGV